MTEVSACFLACKLQQTIFAIERISKVCLPANSVELQLSVVDKQPREAPIV